MAENVYVSEVYDNAGKKIPEDDEVATAFTVWVTPEEVESIIRKMYKKSLIWIDFAAE